MSEREILKTTCPRDCYDACGIAVIRRDSTVTKVLGDPDHDVARGALCGKCALAYNGAWRDPAERLLTPLKRVGNKGDGRFAPCSWEEALGDIAAHLGAIRSGNQGRRILNAHYTGTCAVLGNMFPMRFFNAIGAAEVEPDSICNLAGHIALDWVTGNAVKGFDPRTARDTKCLVVWGANPHASAPHAYKHWLKEQPGKLIVVDPIRTPTAELADLHLRPFPGTDAALAFGIMNVLLAEELVDRDFIARHTHGFEELEPLIHPCTPATVADITGVAAEQIVEAAHLYGDGPSLLWLGQALQRQPLGGNVFRACAMLPALTGNIGKPGAGIYFLNGKGGTRNLPLGDVAGSDLRTLPEDKVSHMDLPDRLNDSGRTGAFVVWNCNPAASNPRQAELREALRREDLFTVVIDLFQTDTADFADYVLPAASFLEYDDLVGSYMHLSLGPQQKVMEPLGEALPNAEIFRQLANHMGLPEPELYEGDREILDRLLEASGLGLDFDELKRRGTVYVSDEPVILWEELEFPTPSGRIEIASDQAEAAGCPRTPRPDTDPRPASGKLRLLSPASVWHMNCSYDNDPNVRNQAGEPTVFLHPEDAAERQLRAGARVRLSSPAGAVELALATSDTVPRGVALSPKGKWPKLVGANVNFVNPGTRADIGGSTAVHGTEVEIAPAQAAE
jgi:anaerobic selenocysteine-containing dehydrogenase